MDEIEPAAPEQLLETPHLADALESDRFKRFLDHIPFAIAVADLNPSEHLTYANIEFERLIGVSVAELEGKCWGDLPTLAASLIAGRSLCEAIVTDEDYIGVFEISAPQRSTAVDVWSNIIQNDDGMPMFRLVALADIGTRDRSQQTGHESGIPDKDVLLRELQHRVKNNLQMITALIRLEARNLSDHEASPRFERLAGRVAALALLYRSLEADNAESVDLGVYLSQIASAVMEAHAVEGIRLDLKVDTWPVSVDVAMPTGLVVNELMTNSLKHAFTGRDGGTITLHSLVDGKGCRVLVSDDGIGLPAGTEWPVSGKLAALIVQSLEQNAGAKVDVLSTLGKGVKASIVFTRADAAP
jgi:two-component sensor histidine kinase